MSADTGKGNMMRTLYKKAIYTLDFGRGGEVVVDEFTDQFVIHRPPGGASQVVADRASFEAEAILNRRFEYRYQWFTRGATGTEVRMGQSNDLDAFAYPVVLDLTLVPDEAFVRGVPG